MGDARRGGGDYLDPDGAADAVVAAEVFGESGLAVGGDGDHRELSGVAEDLGGQETGDLVAAGEPGEHRRHLQHGVVTQELAEGGHVGVLEGGGVQVE
jgi:hypothetical protein